MFASDRPQQTEAGPQHHEAGQAHTRGRGDVGGAGGVSLGPGLHDGGRGGGGQHRTLGQRDIGVKCGQDT